jgi:hypothetical protein
MLSRDLVEKVGGEALDGLQEEYLLCVLNAACGMPEGSRLRDYRATVDALVRARTEPPRRPILTVLHAMRHGPPQSDVLPVLVKGLLGADPWSQALERFGNALVGLMRGDVASAERDLVTALDRFRATGERWG